MSCYGDRVNSAEAFRICDLKMPSDPSRHFVSVICRVINTLVLTSCYGGRVNSAVALEAGESWFRGLLLPTLLFFFSFSNESVLHF